MLDNILAFVAELDHKDLDQEQRAALLDALVVMMLADGRIRFDEETFLRKVAAHVHWEGPGSVHEHILASRVRAEQELAKDDHGSAWIADIAARVGGSPQRRRVYILCDQMANQDYEVTEQEQAVLEQLLAAFS